MGEVSAVGTPPLGLLEVLDREGAVRQVLPVHAWPLRVGRSLDNDLVLDDPHTAPHHFRIDAGEDGRLVLGVGESVNGVRLDGHRLAGGATQALPDTLEAKPPVIVAGRTHLRLRLAAHALAPELPLAEARTQSQSAPRLLLLLLAVAAVLVFSNWLESEPELFVRGLGSFAVSALAVGLGWCGLWALLSKVFTRQAHVGWHLGVMLMALLVWEGVVVGSSLLAFAFSWPWLTDFSFIPGYAIVGAMLYFHLQAVEPLHPRRTLGFAMAAATAGTVLSLWFNLQGTDRPGSELYMNHLFPPALRVAKPVDVPGFVQGLEGLQAKLDEKVRKDAEKLAEKGETDE